MATEQHCRHAEANACSCSDRHRLGTEALRRANPSADNGLVFELNTRLQAAMLHCTRTAANFRKGMSMNNPHTSAHPVTLRNPHASHTPIYFQMPAYTIMYLYLPPYTFAYLYISPYTPIYLKISNIQKMRTNLQHKNGHNSGPRASPRLRI